MPFLLVDKINIFQSLFVIKSVLHEIRDPIRSRIIFELMICGEGSIKYLAQTLKRDRTTINHHINVLVQKKVIQVAREEKNPRGKPTLYYTLVPFEGTRIKHEENKDQRSLLDHNEIAIGALAQSMSMLSSAADLSKEMLDEQNQPALGAPHFMLLMSEGQAKLYYRKLRELLDELKELSEEFDNDKVQYVFYSGLLPIVR